MLKPQEQIKKLNKKITVLVFFISFWEKYNFIQTISHWQVGGPMDSASPKRVVTFKLILGGKNYYLKQCNNPQEYKCD